MISYADVNPGLGASADGILSVDYFTVQTYATNSNKDFVDALSAIGEAYLNAWAENSGTGMYLSGPYSQGQSYHSG